MILCSSSMVLWWQVVFLAWHTLLISRVVRVWLLWGSRHGIMTPYLLFIHIIPCPGSCDLLMWPTILVSHNTQNVGYINRTVDHNNINGVYIECNVGRVKSSFYTFIKFQNYVTTRLSLFAFFLSRSYISHHLNMFNLADNFYTLLTIN